MTALFDARGCLSDAGFQVLAQAAIGQAPAEVASHVASCARCQERMLAGARAELRVRERKAPPPPWRIWVVLGAVIFVLVSILATIQWITHR